MLDTSYLFIAIQNLTQELSELPNVETVRAVAALPEDMHNITFQIITSLEFRESPFAITQEFWELAETLAIEAHWRLQDSTGEKWYFHVDLVDDFEDIDSKEIIALALSPLANI